MRQLTTGLVTGFLFGAVLSASAGYVQHDQWTQMDPQDRLMYVAGLSDMIEVIHASIQALGPVRTTDLVTKADTCTDPLVLGEVDDIAKSAVTRHSDTSPALAIFMDLVDCSTVPSQPSPTPAQRPDNVPNTTAGLLPWQRTPQ